MKTIFNANVDLSGGIEEVTNEVISQVKAVAGAIFLVATVILLVWLKLLRLLLKGAETRITISVPVLAV